ncbi:maleylpyruvate isomerase family mycothiol-dependent enzyme [Thermoactinospora rubra]|uniref:maleylpyruvate isomerase family mycothiol-dependent enzyme n=1 Tax=Thermoactinospora rubra TaxID=1088767 RepID=UPI000A0FFF92|nr:maleylpyruvate isomerase family mycothiol-dependent enzyme [Thermoactinospora rubra]
MTDTSWLGPAIDVRPVLAEQQDAFIDLLRRLDADEWSRPTICPGWTVKDVAAHVLGDHIGRLSIHRDGFHVLYPREGEDFPVFLDRINEEWVIAARRISPPMLIELLSDFGGQIVRFWQTIDLDALGGSVRWAGPGPHPCWLDVAREYTEYWTHQQQICDATGRAGLTDSRYLGPVIDTFLRALPHTLRDIAAPPGTALQVVVTGPGGGTWTCVRGQERWGLNHRPHSQPAARLELDADTTWRLCTRGITPEQAAERAHIDGDQDLAAAALRIVSIIRSQ